MASGKNRLVVTIDANGDPAIGALGKVETAADGVDDAVDGIGDTAGELGGSFGGLQDTLGSLAGPLGAAGIATGLFAAIEQAADLAIEAGSLAEFLGLSVEDASRLNSVFGDVGVEADGVIGIMDNLVTRLAETPELAEKLGIALGPDGVLDPVQAVKTSIDAWDFLTPTEKIELFGE